MGSRGFTIVELLIVSTLSAILLVITLGAFRMQQGSTLALRSRAAVAADLRLATESLLQDLAAAESVTTQPGGRLFIQREEALATLLGSWTGTQDQGVRYYRRGRDFLRQDVATNANVKLTELEDFVLSSEADGLHVTLGAIMLVIIWLRVLRGHFTPDRHFAFEAVAWYWHFVDVVWLGLFFFVYWV